MAGKSSKVYNRRAAINYFYAEHEDFAVISMVGSNAHILLYELRC